MYYYFALQLYASITKLHVINDIHVITQLHVYIFYSPYTSFHQLVIHNKKDDVHLVVAVTGTIYSLLSFFKILS